MSAVMTEMSAPRMASVQRAIVYDCDAERAAEVATVLRFLDLEPMLIDHAAVVRSVMQGCSGRQVLLIGDVADVPDWRELGAALRSHLTEVIVVAYGPQAVA